MNLYGRHFLTLLDYSPVEIRYLLELAKEFKKLKHEGIDHKVLSGKNIVLLFEKCYIINCSNYPETDFSV